MSPAVAVFPRGFKKKKSSHDEEYGHGQEKRRPSTYVGQKKRQRNKLIPKQTKAKQPTRTTLNKYLKPNQN